MESIANKIKASPGKAFTLLELIIVIIIIGILASISLPKYIKVAEKARMAEGKYLLGAIRSSQMRYKVEHGDFATDHNDMDIDFYYSNISEPQIYRKFRLIQQSILS